MTDAAIDEARAALVAADDAFARFELESVITHLSAALRGFTEAGDECAAALTCTRLGDVMTTFMGNLTAARAWYRRAERLVADRPPCIEQGWVAVAAMGCDVEDPALLLERAELALDRARRFGDLNLETKALADGGLAHVQAGRIVEGMAMLDEAMALACGPADDTETASKSVCSFFTACYFAMDFTRAHTWTDLLRQHGLIGPTPGPALFLSNHCDSVQATLLMELGRWDEADALLRRASDAFEATMGPSWHSSIALADLRTRQGRFAEAEVLLLGKEQAPQALLPAARLHHERGDYALALATARRGLDLLAEDRLRAVELLTVIVDAGLATGDVEVAADACADMERRLEGVDVPAFAARLDAARAAVMAARGDAPGAAALLEAAIERIDPQVFPWRRSLLERQLTALRPRSATTSPVAVPGAPATISVAAKWVTLSHGSVTTRLPVTKGLAYVAVLVESPGVERHVFDLVDRVEGVGAPSEGGPAIDRRALGDAGVLADGEARSRLRRRIESLRGDIDDALEAERLDDAETLQGELDALVTHLAAAFGIGGRERAAGSAAEKARLNVTRATRAALKKIEEALPEAGAALDRSIRTGLYCAYAPDQGERICWIVQSGLNESPRR